MPHLPRVVRIQLGHLSLRAVRPSHHPHYRLWATLLRHPHLLHLQDPGIPCQVHRTANQYRINGPGHPLSFGGGTTGTPVGALKHED